MLIAREKRKSNLAEYILYMWQLEDMLRALHLDMTLVDQHIVSGFQVDESTRKEMLDWYDNLVEMMKKEEVTREGHLQVIKNMVSELTEMHYHLLHQTHDVRYRHIFMAAQIIYWIIAVNPIYPRRFPTWNWLCMLFMEICSLNYKRRRYTLKRRRPMESFSRMLAYLSAVYKRMEEENE